MCFFDSIGVIAILALPVTQSLLCSNQKLIFHAMLYLFIFYLIIDIAECINDVFDKEKICIKYIAKFLNDLKQKKEITVNILNMFKYFRWIFLDIFGILFFWLIIYSKKFGEMLQLKLPLLTQEIWELDYKYIKSNAMYAIISLFIFLILFIIMYKWHMHLEKVDIS